ncbi:hypothetical protein D3C80_1689740 [compost metagenome]
MNTSIPRSRPLIRLSSRSTTHSTRLPALSADSPIRSKLVDVIGSMYSGITSEVPIPISSSVP